MDLGLTLTDVTLQIDDQASTRRAARVYAANGFLHFDNLRSSGGDLVRNDVGPHLGVMCPQVILIDAIRRRRAHYRFEGSKIGWMHMLVGYPGHAEGMGTHDIRELVLDVERNGSTAITARMTLSPDPAEEARSGVLTQPIRAMMVRFLVPERIEADLFFDLRGLDREAFQAMLDGEVPTPFYF